MINKEEVILMTKLSIYDKNHGANDKKANEVYYKDYIYIKNFYTRLLALMGCFIVIFIYTINIFLNDNLDFFLIDFRLKGITIVGLIAIVMVVYTVISTKVYTNEYKNIKRRLRTYFRLIKELESLNDKKTT